MLKRLVLMRHARTAANAERRFLAEGDPVLDHVGHSQATRAATALLRIPLNRVFCSPMRRAVQTAELIVGTRIAEKRPSVVTDARLREVGFGVFEGKTEDEILDDGLGQTFFAWRQGVPPRYPPNAETFREAGTRAADFFIECVTTSDATALVVGHSHLLRIMIAVSVLNVPAHWHRRLRLDPGQTAVVEWEGTTPRLVALNGFPRELD